jgi:superfamily II DNA or RNA helicase
LQVALIVFDECHHAGPKKKHPYTQIMQQYHVQKQAGRPVPRILGLTASPVWNVKNPQKAILELEALLDARILEVSKHHQAEMEENSPRAQEQLIEHPPEVVIEKDEYVSAMLARLQSEIVVEEKWVERVEAARLVRPSLTFSLSPC